MVKIASVFVLISMIVMVSGCAPKKDFSTPTKTFETFISALKLNNLSTARACFAQEERANFTEILNSASVIDEKILNDFAQVRVVFTVDGNPVSVTLNFTKEEDGWKITQPQKGYPQNPL